MLDRAGEEIELHDDEDEEENYSRGDDDFDVESELGQTEMPDGIDEDADELFDDLDSDGEDAEPEEDDLFGDIDL